MTHRELLKDFSYCNPGKPGFFERVAQAIAIPHARMAFGKYRNREQSEAVSAHWREILETLRVYGIATHDAVALDSYQSEMRQLAYTRMAYDRMERNAGKCSRQHAREVTL